jgi:hypothetical protein
VERSFIMTASVISPYFLKWFVRWSVHVQHISARNTEAPAGAVIRPSQRRQPSVCNKALKHQCYTQTIHVLWTQLTSEDPSERSEILYNQRTIWPMSISRQTKSHFLVLQCNGVLITLKRNDCLEELETRKKEAVVGELLIKCTETDQSAD